MTQYLIKYLINKLLIFSQIEKEKIHLHLFILFIFIDMFHCLLKTSPKREHRTEQEVFTVTLYFSCALFNLNITVNK